jgi:hypothetical protein
MTKKESKYQKYIYQASIRYQYYGEWGQDTNTKLFWKSVVWKLDCKECVSEGKMVMNE